MIESRRAARSSRARSDLALGLGLIATSVLFTLIFYTSVVGTPALPSLSRLLHVLSLRESALSRAELSKALGLCAMSLLALSLVAGPLARIAPLSWVLALRRERKFLGVSAFAFALAHAGSSLGHLLLDAVELTTLKGAGLLLALVALAILLRMAQTSTKRARSRLGAERWRRIHRLGGLALALGVLHFFALEISPVEGLHVRSYGLTVLATALVALLVRVLARMNRVRALRSDGHGEERAQRGAAGSQAFQRAGEARR